MKEIFEEKKRALMEGDEALVDQVAKAKDVLSILSKLSMELSFTFAATDTTSNALSRTLLLLTFHPEAQERLRAEVIEARKLHNGDIPYDNLVSLPFLDAVCRETLRLHPPVPKL
ncbi:hypothetical protein C0992_012247 [Termitomyces sp. T32_za158]|nr:hypothetical protein C0992_012247 [Termitomyces sp. T32_za158]